MTSECAEQDIRDWMHLARTPGVGPETARRLLGAIGTPDLIFRSDFDTLAALAGTKVARALLGPIPDATQELIDKTLRWIDQPENHIFTLASASYPPQLLNIADPPLLLYAKGQRALLRNPALAVVGSRNATQQGMLNAEKFSVALSQAGLTIVSGLALGIDTAAHQGGLQGAASTVAVIGTGADIVYPARNRELAHRIAEQGCIISEYPLGMPAIAANFPRRNRIISGLSRGILVVEAAAQSGSLITARMAGEQGRDVFAIPGSIHSPLAKGCHLLIKQGAKLVEEAADILEEIPSYIGSAPVAAARPPSDTPTELHPLLAALGFDPASPEELSLRCKLDMASVQAQLFSLEMEGQIEVLPGGKVRRLVLA